MSQTVSIIIPVYNEGENVERIYGRLMAVFSGPSADLAPELIFSDNASADDTFDRVRALSQRDPRVKGIRLSRNFGFQANILSGLLNASGDAVIQVDADGEDPPELIPEFIARWKEGYDVVYGIRKGRRESAWLTLQRKWFYRLLNAMSDLSLPVDAGDFRLIDRRVAQQVRDRFPESNPYLRGLISYAGFRQIGIPYERSHRAAGTSKFSRRAYWTLAWDAMTSFTRTPLRMVSVMGLTMSALSFIGIIYYLIDYFILGIPVQGFATLIVVLLLVAGVQTLSLGIVGEYICRIFDEVKRRPRTIVAESCGFADKPREA